jgi:signal transduction histidine kinase
MIGAAPAHGRVDGEGRLIEADPALAQLHARAGGTTFGPLAIPALARVAALAKRLGIVISRGITAADEDRDLDLWVRAEPEGGTVRLAIGGWTARDPRQPSPAPRPARDRDQRRAAADWLWESDAALKLVSLSPGAERALGTTGAGLAGRALSDLFHLLEDPAGRLPMLDALAGAGPFADQQVALRADRSRRFALAGVPLIDGDGHLSGFSGTARSLGRADPALPTGSPVPGGGEAFAGRLDHALRLPLDRIIAHAETMRTGEEGALRAEYQDYAADIAGAARHLLSLVDDLVDLQAIERPDFAPEIEPVDLADLARRAAGLLAVRAADRQVVITRPGAGASVPARGEFRRVLQILLNLIGNAVRHAPPGTAVDVSVDAAGDRAAVMVADHGRGLAPADQARIFEKFVRIAPTEGSGSGLGLYIARRLARAMGGDLQVDSAPGEGARFVLILPGGAAG